MRRFRDLVISGTEDQLRAFVEDLSARLQGWARDEEREQQLERDFIGGAKSTAIRTPPGGELPDAMLYLYREVGAGKCSVGNIVPVERGTLSIQQYNGILQSFYDAYVRDRAEQFGLTARLSKEVITSRDVLSEENAHLLHRFSVCANMSTGSGHPADGGRWRDFITSSFRSEEILDSGSLTGLLADEGWPDEQIHKLVSEYESAIDVLWNYTGRERFK